MTSILATLCDAQDRYATAAGVDAFVETERGERNADPRDGLLHALWIVLDADGSIIVRLGDEPAFPVDMENQCSLVDDVLTLGGTAIDLSMQKVEYMNDLTRTTQFLIDGAPLRFTYAAGHVDGNIESYDALQSMVRDVQNGTIAGVVVSIDGTDAVLGPDDVRLSEGDEDYGDPVFADLMTYSCLEGPLLDGRGEGPVEGLDFLGRHIRVSRIAAEPVRLAA
jgi:hypothetical protein